MPENPPSSYDSESAWMEDCVPYMIDNHDMDQDQAVAACLNMWRERSATSAVQRCYSLLTVKSISEPQDGEQRFIRGIATTPAPDRLGDIVEPLGLKFANPIPLLLHHRSDEPVGTAVFKPATDKGIEFEATIARIAEPGRLRDRVEEAWQSLKAGLIRGVSIGFRALEQAMIGNTGGVRFTKGEVLELSLVTVPANSQATIQVIRSLDAAQLAASGTQSSPASSSTTPRGQGSAVPGGTTTGWAAPLVNKATRPGVAGAIPLNTRNPAMKSLSEQVADLQNTRAAKQARMAAIMQKAMDDGRSTDEAEQEEFDTLEQETKAIDGDLRRLDILRKANENAAQPVAGATREEAVQSRSAPAAMIRVAPPAAPPGVRFARVVKAIGMAKGNLVGATQIAEKNWPDDQPISNILKAAVAAGTTTDETWAGALVSAEGGVFADFVEYLRPMTILGKFGTNNIPSLRRVPFRTALISQDSGMAGYWVGQAAAKPLTRMDLSRTTLEPMKVANIAVLTDEVVRSSSPSAETLVRDELAKALRERLDIDFINPLKTAAAGVSPASITNGATAIPSSGAQADAVRADIQALFAVFLAANNPPEQGVWIMSASTALAVSLMTNPLGQPEFPGLSLQGGTLFNLPVIVSQYVNSYGSPVTGIVALIDASGIYLADEGGINIDMSREASLEMADNPSHSSAAGSPAAPVPATLVSMFQTNSVAFRCERTITWARRRDESVAYLTGVDWGGVGSP